MDIVCLPSIILLGSILQTSVSMINKNIIWQYHILLVVFMHSELDSTSLIGLKRYFKT